MSGQATGWVLRYGPQDRAKRLVLLAIADAANANGEHAHPGIETICRGSLYKRAHVLAKIRELVDEGWLEIEEEGGGRGMATVYRLPMKTVQFSDAPDENGPISDAKPSNPEGETVQSSAIALSTATDTTVKNNADVSDVVRVFEFWKENAGKPRAVLDDKRRRLISKALKDYPLADVLHAVVGWKNSPFHRGENDTGTTYNDLGLLLRNAAKIEFFRDLAFQGPTFAGRAAPESWNVLKRLKEKGDQ